jgi:acyl-CoA thioesterase FadM
VDCHAAWTAFAIECRDMGVEVAESSVPTGWTRSMTVDFLKPTPLDTELIIKAALKSRGRTSRTVECSIFAHDVECVRATVHLVMK